MEKTWVLIANAQRARCFERHATDHSLTELIDFVHPHASVTGKASGGDLTRYHGPELKKRVDDALRLPD